MSVIIAPECYQESQDIQDLTVKPSICNQVEQSPALPQCPQCGITSNDTSIRLVHDTCGHLKCRLCLLKEDDSCMTCEEERIGMIQCYVEAAYVEAETEREKFLEPVRTPVIEERGTILMQSSSQSEFVPTPMTTPMPVNMHVETIKIKSESFLNGNNDRVLPLRFEGVRPCSPEVPKDNQDDEPLSGCNDELLSGCNEDNPDDPIDEDHISDVPAENTRKRKPKGGFSHIITVTGSPVTYKCTICNKSFKSRSHIGYHEFCGSDKKPYNCEICGRGFVAKAHFLYHKRLHTGERPFQCSFCEKRFNQKGKLTRHNRTHTGERPFICELCGKGFSNSHAMQNHRLTHDNERPHKCSHCSKCFTERSNLKKHFAAIHSNERPYVCEKCGKDFPLSWALTQHYLTHTGQRGYKCDSCEKCFITKRDLKRHRNIHSNIRQYKCLAENCKVATSRKDNLERHMRGLHPHLYPSEQLPSTETEPTIMNKTVLQLPKEQITNKVFATDVPSTSLLVQELEPARSNAVPVINSAPPSSSTSISMMPPPGISCSGYTTRNLHPETSPHLFVSSKNVQI